MFQDRYDIRLNLITLRFNQRKFIGAELPYESYEQLKELRENHRNTHVFMRSGNVIQCIPIEDSTLSLGKEKQYDVLKHFTLANRLVHQALIRFLNSKNYEFSSIFPTTKIIIKKENMLMNIIGNHYDDSLIYLYPQYEIESRLIVPHNGKVKFGILFNFSVKHGFNATVSDLISKGIDVSGCYVVKEGEIKPESSIVDPKYKRKLIGKVDGINGTTIKLNDYREEDESDSTKCFLEPRPENILNCLAFLYPDMYEQLLSRRQSEIFKVTGARNQVERLGKLITWLKEYEPIKCSNDLSFTISNELYSPAIGRDAGKFRMLKTPDCVLRPGGSITVKWPVDPQLEEKGPFDTESFPKKVTRIAVIFPRRFQGEVEIFMRQFKDGISDKRNTNRFVPYSQGFIRKYRLTSCKIDLFPLEGSSEDAEAYRKKCLEVLNKGEAYDLSIVVIKEDFHKLSGAENPYLVVKSAFMSQGLPVQEIEIETIQEKYSRPYVLNNVAVACYAKLGGIPWVLSSVKGLTHELIFGIGFAKKSHGRLSSSERLVGITTVFSGDGNYLLSNVSKEVPFEEYQESLLRVLKNCLEQIRRRYAWQTGDKVRLIFHQTFKKYKDVEAAAVKTFVDEISGFDVEYAFVHIGRSHPWRIFDLYSDGINFKGNKKGEYVPWRGCYIPLGPRAALLGLTGPYQLKTHLQGCPEPILISLHRESTFNSLDYVSEQIYKLAYMSWRSFFPASMPVTIAYSDLIAKLLGELKDIPNWNPDMLITKLSESRWFL